MWFSNNITEDKNRYIITWFPVQEFLKAIVKEYRTTKIQRIVTASGFKFFGYRTISIHKFFIPELLYLLKKFNFSSSLINTIIENTWVSKFKRVTKNYPSLVSEKMNITLKDYQQEYIEKYPELKDTFQLRGMILSFDQGLGKTMTSLATMISLKKEKTIIVAPKSTLYTVWAKHVKEYITKDNKVYILGDNEFSEDYDYYILNYEAMSKFDPYLNIFTKYNTGIILDESHNFLKKSNRTVNALNLIRKTKASDSLLLSGTPLKSVGSEIIPMLLMLDKFFDEDAVNIFKSAFGMNTTLASDILHSRLSHIMYRKVKEEVLALPKKTELTMKVKISDGEKYTIQSVKEIAEKYANERLAYHRDHMKKYVSDYNLCMDWIKENTDLPGTPEFSQYEMDIRYLRSISFSVMDKQHMSSAQRTNDYEKKVIYPLLPNDLKRKFKESKTAVKYVELKVRGEVIGSLLINLRKEMTSKIVEKVDFKGIINKAMKKTIIFSSFVDSVEVAYDHIRSLGFKPLLLHGGEGNAKTAVEKFQTDYSINPLISTTQMLVTGVTLTEANTMLFLNKPFRYTDYLQASDRIHRIGQDTDVFIYTILLDTGQKGNLSTRMEDIMEWSRSGFEGIVNGNDTNSTKRLYQIVMKQELDNY